MTSQPSALVLYADRFWISPYVFSCIVALREKGLPHDIEEVALDRGEQHEPLYASRSITGRVPALRHGEFWLAESSAIIEYLDEVFADAPRMLPDNLHDRARARQVMAWVRSDLAALREERPTTTMFYSRADKPLTAAGQAAAAKLVQVASALIPSGSPGRDGGVSLFARWCIADADLAFMLQRLILNGHDVPAPVRAYADAQWARPSVQTFVTHARPPYRAY